MENQDNHGESWDESQDFEKEWWGDCLSTYSEERKQLVYALKMGLVVDKNDGKVEISLNGQSVLDIGGGPVSILLKCKNFRKGQEDLRNTVVIDPLMDQYPEWVKLRYKAAGIIYKNKSGEDVVSTNRTEEFPDGELPEGFYDEVWIYNVLQHVQDPKKIIDNARRVGKLIRIFEWVEKPISPGHPHSLTSEQLDEWLGGIGSTEEFKGESGLHGKGYFGIFPTKGGIRR